MRVSSMSNLAHRRVALQALFLFVCILVFTTTGALANPQNADTSMSSDVGVIATTSASTSGSAASPTISADSSVPTATNSDSASATSTPTSSHTIESIGGTSAAAPMHVTSFSQISFIISLAAVTAGAAKLLL